MPAEIAQSAPPVLLIHGFGSSFDHGWRATGWVDMLEDAGREPIGGDLLGHGEAPRYYSADEYLHWEDHVWTAADGRAPVDAVGFSLGGLTLLRMAADHPQRFRRLAVLGVGDYAAGLTPRDEVPAARVPDLLGMLEGAPEGADPGSRAFQRLLAGARHDRRALAAVLRRPQRRVTAEELGRIDCETLLVQGDADFTGPATRLAATLPRARLVRLERTDHFATPSSIAAMAEVLDFLSG